MAGLRRLRANSRAEARKRLERAQWEADYKARSKPDPMDALVNFILDDNSPVTPEDAHDIALFDQALARAEERLASRDLRSVIDSFELWKCNDDPDGYNAAADKLADLMARHNPTTKYYFNEHEGIIVQVSDASPHKD